MPCTAGIVTRIYDFKRTGRRGQSGGPRRLSVGRVSAPGRRRAFLARRFTPRVETAIAERFDIVRPTGDRPMSAAEIRAAAVGCEALFVSATESVTAEVFDALAPTLTALATLSVGFDHIELDAARRHRVAVLTTPDVLSVACAEIGMLLILNAARRGHEANALVRSGSWTGWAPTQLLGMGLEGKRLGILGMGRIGRELARRAASFGVAIFYHNRTRLPEALERGATYCATPEALLRQSDILCLCVPGGGKLRKFVDRERIGLLPHGAIVINIARGDLIDDDALIEALSTGRLCAAGLDVFQGEPSLDPRYRTLDNVFLTPHIGSATEATRDAMGLMLVAAIDALARGENPSNRIA